MENRKGSGMSIKHQQGFSLLEVLISMVIIMFGLLGMAGVQMLAINNTENARYQVVATNHAASLAAMMRGNYAFWATPRNITITGATAGASSTTLTGFGTVPAATNCESVVCDAAQMAYFDLQNWGYEVVKDLPAGTSAITCSATAIPTTCTITMSWSENNVALSNRSATGTEAGDLASGTAANHTYTTLVSIII